MLFRSFELANIMENSIEGSPPAAVLKFETDVSRMSVAERMSWAACRRTTRVEDEAYSLFGLFGINMPTLYGEGRNAFFRLQQEIMRTSPDTSLFAWTDDVHCATDWEELRTSVPGEGERQHPESDPACHLFAYSPQYFRRARTSFQILPGATGNGKESDHNVSHAHKRH